MHLTSASKAGGFVRGSSEEESSGSSKDQSAKAEPKQHASCEPRERGLSEQGRGSSEGDRPPAVLCVERSGSGRVLELQDVTKRTLLRSAMRDVEPGSRIDTDDFSSYRLLKKTYEHRSVDHEETYVSDEGTHCHCR